MKVIKIVQCAAYAICTGVFITGSGRKRRVFHGAPFLWHAFKGTHTSDMLDLFNNLWLLLGGSLWSR